jgi:hypothetical protein
MGLYNFQQRFVPFIESGAKKHTIRATRANPDKPGNTLHLYTGLRRKGARLIARVKCVRISEIEILRPACSQASSGIFVFVDGVELDRSECEGLARKDGFKDFAEMKDFWKDSLPFKGQIIHWTNGGR